METPQTPRPEQQPPEGSTQSLLRAFSVTSAAGIAGKAIAIVTIPLLARGLGVGSYGLLDTALLLVVLAALFGRLGVDQAACRYVALARSPEEVQAYASTGLVLILGASASAAVVLACLLPILQHVVFSGALGLLAAMALIGKVMTEGTAMFLADLMRFTDNLRWYILGTLGIPVLAMIQLVVLAAAGHLTLSTAITVYFVTDVAVIALLLLRARRYVRPRVTRKYVRPLLAFGLPLIASTGGFFIMNASDRFFLAGLHLYTDLSRYAVAYKIAVILTVVQFAFAAVWTPFALGVYKRSPADTRSRFPLISRWYVAGTCLLSLAIIAVAKPLASLIGGGPFRGAATVVPLILAAFLANGYGNWFSVGVNFTGRTRLVALASGGAAILNLGLNIVLIPAYGMIGAGIATFVSYYLASVALMAISQRLFHIGYPAGRTHALYVVIASFSGLLLAGASPVVFYLSLAGVAVLVWISMGISLAEIRSNLPSVSLLGHRARTSA